MPQRRSTGEHHGDVTEPAFPPPPLGGAFTVESTLTRSEFVWAHRAMVRASGKYTHPAMSVVFVAAIALGFWLRSRDASWFPTALIVLGVIGLAIGLILAVLPYGLYRIIPEDRRVQTLEVTPDGIASGNDEVHIAYTWDAVKHVVRGPAAIALVTHSRGEGVIVADRCVDAAQAALLDQLLRDRAPHANTIVLR